MASVEKLIRIVLKLQDNASKPLKEAGNSVKQMSSDLKKLGGELTGIGQQMSIAITAPVVAAGAAGVKMAMDLDRAMRNIQSVGKQTEDEIAALSDTFIQMSTDISMTTDSAQNLAEAFYDIQGSGFEGADAMKVLEAATKAASAGLTETAVAAEGITAVINSYGLAAEDASHISDLMFATVDRGVGSFEELTSSLSNVTGLASTLNVPFEEVSAAIATMSKQGFTFSEASVSLNQALTSIIKPTLAMDGAIQALGYSSGSAMIDALGLGGSIQALSDHVGGSTDQLAAMFGNVRGLRAALALTGNGAQMFAEDMEAMANATGRTAEAFAIQTKSFEAQFKSFQNTLNAMLIEIGQELLPVINDFLQNYIIPAIQWFRGLDDSTKRWIIGLVAAAAALGPILIILGQLISAFGAIMSIMPAIGTGFMFLSGTAIPALIAALTPILPILAAITIALGAFAIAWQTNFLNIQGIVDGFTSSFQESLATNQGYVEAFKNATGNALQALAIGLGLSEKAAWDLKESFKLAFDSIISFLTGGITGVFRDIGKNLINGLMAGTAEGRAGFIKMIADLVHKAITTIKSALGIRSPSKVMAAIGENMVKGFNSGIAGMGGLGVQVPTVNGLSPNTNMPSMGLGLAGGSASGGGGGNVIIQNLTVPAGTSQEQIEYISREIAKRAKRRGAREL